MQWPAPYASYSGHYAQPAHDAWAAGYANYSTGYGEQHYTAGAVGSEAPPLPEEPPGDEGDAALTPPGQEFEQEQPPPAPADPQQQQQVLELYLLLASRGPFSCL